jgi:GH15 family glucan-1,4-alpha-glucosidase
MIPSSACPPWPADIPSGQAGIRRGWQRATPRYGTRSNYDYRYAWVRDAAYTIKAFLRAGALAEATEAFGWLVRTIDRSGSNPKVVYTLRGDAVPDEVVIDVPGYRGSTPVRTGNRARDQIQLSCYGDVLETAALFAENGHVLNREASALLSRLADRCVQRWREKDSGIWELEDLQHYTFSKIGCWLALSKAAQLARDGHIEGDSQAWQRESELIQAWIDENCWSDAQQAYTFYPGTARLDASLLLAIRFGFEHDGRLEKTRNAIENELARGPLVFRYSGAEEEEGTFVACACWLVEAYAFLGDTDIAKEKLEELLKSLGNNFGILSEQIDAITGEGLGNVPQGLSHLALLHAILSVQENRSPA